MSFQTFSSINYDPVVLSGFDYTTYAFNVGSRYYFLLSTLRNMRNINMRKPFHGFDDIRNGI